MKNLSVCFFSLFFCSLLFADEYKISKINYQIFGITSEYALKKAVDIDNDRIFKSYDEFNTYIDDLRQQFSNERNFSSTTINVSYEPTNTSGICLTTLNIITQDSKHLIALPYPKYSSNDGFMLKLKLKDTNFLGTLSTLNFDLNFAIEQENENDDPDYVFGMNFDYDYPFQFWKFDSSWNNSFSLSYTLGKSQPEFSLDTGFTFSLPFKDFSVQLDLTQGIARDFDYKEFDDSLYYTELIELSIPITIADLGSFGTVKWGPELSYTWNWDKNGIDRANEDLSGPTLAIGHSVTAGRVNWTGNYRNGLSMNLTQNVGYNCQLYHYTATILGELEGFKSFSKIGFNTRFYAFYNLNKTAKIGDYLRGIRDDQTYKNSLQKALRTKAAIIGNIDIPIHIVTTNWNEATKFIFGTDSWMTNHLNWMRHFDFELQISPFVDFAFSKNSITEKTFAIKDGWYTAGLEFLVYPAKWRSLVVRASTGVDIGRKIIKKAASNLIDDSWRSECETYEIYIGIGWHY